jgi:beta-1,4-mannosyltransferase
MQMLFKGFPEECNALKSLKEGAMKSASSSKWSTEWEANALPLVNQASDQTFFLYQENSRGAPHCKTFVLNKKGQRAVQEVKNCTNSTAGSS